MQRTFKGLHRMHSVLKTLLLLGVVMSLLSNLPPQAVLAAPKAVTVWTQTVMAEEWRGGTHTESVWLARLHSESDDAVALGLVWQRESSGWFATWRLQLISETGLLPGSQIQDLMTTAPLGGLTYQAALSYDPATGAYSAQVTDVGRGHRLVSVGGVLATFDSTLLPKSWDGAAYRTAIHQTTPAYIPVAVEWHVEDIEDEDASPKILNPFTPLTIHLTTHGSPVPGEFRFYISKDSASHLLFTMDAQTDMASADGPFPHGLLTLQMEYVAAEDGRSLLTESQSLSHGALEFRLASVTPGNDQLQGVLEIQSPFALAPAQLQINAELAAMQWNEATRTYEESAVRSVNLFNGPIALAAGNNTVPFTLDAPSATEGTLFRLRVEPQFHFPIAQVVHDMEATFSVGSDACRLDVMSFNIRVPANDGINTWPNRRPMVERMLREYAPAIIGMQEPADVQLYDLDGMLTDYKSIRIRPDSSARVHNAIFYRPDKVELLSWGRYWLSDTPEVAQSATWGNSEARAVLWARFRFLATGEIFYVLDTHFHHVDPSETIGTRSAQLILERLDELTEGLPVILMGDFNAMPGTPAHRLFVEGEKARFVDAWQAAAARTGPEGTYHGFTGRSGGSRIDWVLVTPGIDVLAAEHVTYHEGPVYPSDHFPVYVTLCLPGGH